MPSRCRPSRFSSAWVLSADLDSLPVTPMIFLTGAVILSTAPTMRESFKSAIVQLDQSGFRQRLGPLRRHAVPLQQLVNLHIAHLRQRPPKYERYVGHHGTDVF